MKNANYIFFLKTNNDKHKKEEEMSRSNKVAYPVFIVSHFYSWKYRKDLFMNGIYDLSKDWISNIQSRHIEVTFPFVLGINYVIHSF